MYKMEDRGVIKYVGCGVMWCGVCVRGERVQGRVRMRKTTTNKQQEEKQTKQGRITMLRCIRRSDHFRVDHTRLGRNTEKSIFTPFRSVRIFSNEIFLFDVVTR